MTIEELEKKLEQNSKHIIENSNRIESNLSKIQENSYALEILKDYKQEVERLHEDNSNLTKTMYILLAIIVILSIGIVISAIV